MSEEIKLVLSLYVLVAMFIYKHKYNEAIKYIEDLERENDDLMDELHEIRDQQRRSSADHEAENAKSREKNSDAKNN